MERRSFFKLAGLSAAVLAVGGTLGACEAGKLPDNPLAATNKANETSWSIKRNGAAAHQLLKVDLNNL